MIKAVFIISVILAAVMVYSCCVVADKDEELRQNSKQRGKDDEK